MPVPCSPRMAWPGPCYWSRRRCRPRTSSWAWSGRSPVRDLTGDRRKASLLSTVFFTGVDGAVGGVHRELDIRLDKSPEPHLVVLRGQGCSWRGTCRSRPGLVHGELDVVADARVDQGHHHERPGGGRLLVRAVMVTYLLSLMVVSATRGGPSHGQDHGQVRDRRRRSPKYWPVHGTVTMLTMATEFWMKIPGDMNMASNLSAVAGSRQRRGERDHRRPAKALHPAPAHARHLRGPRRRRCPVPSWRR